MILSSCARLLARAWGLAYTFACLNVTTYCNSFSQTEEVWINETCLKAKIKASAWKTIRKTQYSCYENYFQVFWGFSKKNYPDILFLLPKNKRWAPGVMQLSLNSALFMDNTVTPQYIKGPRDWHNVFTIARFRYIEVIFHIFYYCWGKENHSLHGGLHYV